MFRKGKDEGFTLVELMIVVVIIGILAAIAIPKFTTITTKSKDSEAKNVLAQLYTLEVSFRDEYSRFSSNTDSLGYKDPGMKYWASLAFSNITDSTFTAKVTENGDVDGDKKKNNTYWQVTQASREATKTTP